jgi:hypothetical protein
MPLRCPIVGRSGTVQHPHVDLVPEALCPHGGALLSSPGSAVARPTGLTGKSAMRKPTLLMSLPVIALILFSVPSRFEGPVLIPISPGHGLSLVDLAAVVPLVAGLSALGVFLVRRRADLEDMIRRRPWAAATVLFGAGIGLGLLFASVFPFFWWWAVGATLFTLALVLVALAAARRVRGRPDSDALSAG